ncbi:hypothetical protein BJ508DRAFT_208402 [Ascobolus immersus RN42]|uniref:Endosomal peripheral membrane protein n=1 Tax=Ascobolus immersus RN42 TaxID=1160509 RepID=A0A3N4I7X3_ASCIM|nr:hypothetical protein BJ508DRAFT_208402 [Ascobolus immersus RN42]
MAAHVLTSDLTGLLHETKRKFSDVKSAAEKSLADLKSLGGLTEAQLAAELSDRSTFVTPFIQACKTKNAKVSAIGVGSLQRIIVSKALARSRLKEAVDALRDGAQLGVDVQLKILQSLPAILQNYGDEVNGPLLSDILHLCSTLQAGKNAIVNNTAAATFLQLVVSTFDKVVDEDASSAEVQTVGEVPTETGSVALKPAAADAYQVFHDVCLLTEGHKARFLQEAAFTQSFGLELIESLLSNHPNLFITHPEQTFLVKSRVLPLVIRLLSDRQSFSTAVRTARVMLALIKRHLIQMPDECEKALSLLIYLLDADSAMLWKRALCLEVFKAICADAELVRTIYSHYDAVDGKRNVVGDLMGSLTRLATEKPAVIGLSTQSTVPSTQFPGKDSSSEQAALEAGGVAGIIGGAVGVGDLNVPGLSTQWSLIRVPCLEQLDKQEPPVIPESYIYCLTLNCVNFFAEGLAKFILPLATPVERSKSTKPRSRARSATVNKGSDVDYNSSDSTAVSQSPSRTSGRRKSTRRKQYLPPNPVDLKEHPQLDEILTAASIVEACWPAVLASFSTFLYASLDNDFYHNLVRSFQKFTHVSGLLRLHTPRDAFLTTLGKAAVPSNVLSANYPSENQQGSSNTKGLLSVETNTAADRTSSDVNSSLNSRNLLCLRALLNLGIGLGPVLGSAWSIVLETLQQADFVLYASSRKASRTASTSKPDLSRADSGALTANLAGELAAVEAVSAKMFEATKNFPDAAVVDILTALSRLMYETETTDSPAVARAEENARPKPPRSPTFMNMHKRVGSMASNAVALQISENVFPLAKMAELGHINISRLLGPDASVTGWDLLVGHLASVSTSRNFGNSIRIKAAEVLNEISVLAAQVCTDEGVENIGEIQRRILAAVRSGTENEDGNPADSATKSTDLEIQQLSLESLNSILEHGGQSLIAGWDIVFEIINSVFELGDGDAFIREPIARSPKLVRSSFNSLQLICSDFLSNLPTSCILVLVDTLHSFAYQKYDLNISLTTITYFWNISDFLQARGNSGLITSKATNEEELMQLLQRADVDNVSLWLVLLLRLTAVSYDIRAEVRNGSIQTLFRIFDTYGHKLSPQAWRPCLTTVVFKMMGIDQPEDTKSQASERKSWNDTINLVLEGIGTLYAHYFEIFCEQSEFTNTWRVFLEYLDNLLKRNSYEVNAMIFKVLTQVLEKVPSPDKLGDCLQDTWTFWSSQGQKVAEGDMDGPGSGIQDCLTAYVTAFKPLYRLIEPTIDVTIVEKSLDLLKECILFPDAPAYFQDLEFLTPLQQAVADNLQLIRTTGTEIPQLYIKKVSSFILFPYLSPSSLSKNSAKGSKPLTYVALSMLAMDLLEKTVQAHALESEIYESGALSELLAALSHPIQLKYNFPPASKPTKYQPTWQRATVTAISILRHTLHGPALSLSISSSTRAEIVEKAVTITDGILRAECPDTMPDDTLQQHEQFDRDHFSKLRGLLIPVMQEEYVTTSIVEKYAAAVYTNSILFPGIDDGEEVLTAAKSDKGWGRKLGYTGDAVPRKRSALGYDCYDELFQRLDKSESRRLADVVAPYLIARAALVLRKYIADQPLRGNIPQPVSHRKELLYTLKRLTELETGVVDGKVKGMFHSSGSHSQMVVANIASAPEGTTKAHLFRLLPLFAQVVKVASKDSVVLEAAGKVVEKVWEEVEA